MGRPRYSKSEAALWLEKNIHRVRKPVMSREAYFGVLTQIYYKATKSHWDSELAAEIHVDFAIDGHCDLSFTEFQILKSCNEAVWEMKREMNASKAVA